MELMDLIVEEIKRRESFDNDLKKMGAELSILNCISLSKDNYYNLMLSPNAKLVTFEENEVQEVKVEIPVLSSQELQLQELNKLRAKMISLGIDSISKLDALASQLIAQIK